MTAAVRTIAAVATLSAALLGGCADGGRDRGAEQSGPGSFRDLRVAQSVDSARLASGGDLVAAVWSAKGALMLSTNRGGGFGPPRVVVPGVAAGYEVGIDRDSGLAVIVWQDAAEIRIAAIEPSGDEAWSASAPGPSRGVANELQVAVGGGETAVAWMERPGDYDDPSGRIVTARFDHRGRALATQSVAALPNLTGTSLELAAGPRGDALVTWTAQRGATQRVLAAHAPAGDGFRAPRDLAPRPGSYASRPAVAYDGRGTARVAFISAPDAAPQAPRVVMVSTLAGGRQRGEPVSVIGPMRNVAFTLLASDERGRSLVGAVVGDGLGRRPPRGELAILDANGRRRAGGTFPAALDVRLATDGRTAALLAFLPKPSVSSCSFESGCGEPKEMLPAWGSGFRTAGFGVARGRALLGWYPERDGDSPPAALEVREATLPR